MEKIVIVGPMGSGKTYLLNELIKTGLRPCVKYTNRPIRENEKNGIDYHFIEDGVFEHMMESDLFLITQKFEVKSDVYWKYAITKSEYRKAEVVILTPGELKKLKRKNDLFVIYLDIDIVIRRNRLLKRNDDLNEVNRRLESDKLDFENFNDYTLRIKDENFVVDEILDFID